MLFQVITSSSSASISFAIQGVMGAITGYEDDSPRIPGQYCYRRKTLYCRFSQALMRELP